MSDLSQTAQQPFVELNRRFRTLDQKAKAEETALDSYTAGLLWPDKNLSWDDLLNESRVIVLGEAGSGKTWELRERVRLLTVRGEFAFFIRLDQLVGRELKTVLNAEEQGRYAQWKQSTSPAHFFLDSVDEAKFHKVSDFYATLQRFANEIGTDSLGRAKLFLSSRISEWKPASDAFEFRRLFPLPPTMIRTGNDGGSKSVNDEKPFPLVVHIQPLDKAQVECLARAQGVLNVSLFIDALDCAFAWEFARRPLDVSDLIGFWKDRGRIGSLTELVEFDISSKLRPRAGRDELQLSEAEGREGAEWLAAASLFSRKFSFFVPDDNPTESEALNPLDCLPSSWRDDQARALLSRAIFDSAVYGRFRFHHRRVGEFLAAKWIAARMDNGCPQYELEHILVENVRGRKVLRPALRPVAAWLCYGNKRWNQLVRSLIVELDPEIHLNFGDPASLTVDYRRQVLAALAGLSRQRRRTWLETSHDCLARFADQSLSPDIKAFILDRTLAVDFRIEMLEIVRHGRLAECVDAAISVIASPDEPDDIKLYAAMVIGAIGSKAARTQLHQIGSQLPRIPNRLCPSIVEALYPKEISSTEVVKLLAKTEPVREFGLDLPFYLKSHFESVLLPEDAGVLLKELLVLAQSQPHILHGEKTIPVSGQFYWIGRVIPTILAKLFKKNSLSPDDIHAVAVALQLLGHIRECHHDFTHDEMGTLNELSLEQPSVRQNYLWRVVAAFREEHKAEPTMSLQVFDHWEVLRLSSKDFPWLLEDTRQQKDANDRILALRLAIEAWDGSGRTFTGRWQLYVATRREHALRAAYKQSVVTGPFFPVKRFWYQKVRYRYGKWWWMRKIDSGRARWWWMREQYALLRKLKFIESGKPVEWLARLSQEADEKNNDHWTASSWVSLEKKRGKRITRAAKRGCVAVWRSHIPQLPHEKPDPNKTSVVLIVGLTGLQIEFDENPKAITRLTEAEAALAARYAMDELNGFPAWIENLAAAHSTAVKQVLCECVEAEWKCPADHKDTHEVLANLAWRGGTLIYLIRDKVLSLLTAGDPQNYAILRYALSLLMRQPNPPLVNLGELAAQRTPAADNPAVKVLWLSLWMQIDGESAVKYLQSFLKNSPKPDDIVVCLCSALSGEDAERGPFITSPSYLQPACLLRFIPLVYAHVRISEDLNRSGGAYSPTARDHAERFRSALLEQFAKSESLEATDRLRELADEPAMSQGRDWILNLLDQRLRREADFLPWTPTDLRNFAQHHEVDPKSDNELFAIAQKRIRELKRDVEESDNSLRDELPRDGKEIHLRRWLARKLNERANNRYNVPQEPEIDLQQRPDLRFLRPGLPPVSVEVKLADFGWSIADLIERLENQLVGQYLRDHQSRYGIYVIGTIGRQQHWKHPKTGQLMAFAEVIGLLTERALELVQQNPRIGNLAVVGIDFCEPKRS